MWKNTPVAGESVASFLRRNKRLSAGARLGVERKTPTGWENAPLSARLQKDDRIRVKAARGGHSNAAGLKALTKAIVLAQKR